MKSRCPILAVSIAIGLSAGCTSTPEPLVARAQMPIADFASSRMESKSSEPDGNGKKVNWDVKK